MVPVTSETTPFSSFEAFAWSSSLIEIPSWYVELPVDDGLNCNCGKLPEWLNRLLLGDEQLITDASKKEL